MTVIAFPPRPAGTDLADAGSHHAVTGTFRSPRGRSGEMHGILRVAELRQAPSGVRLEGVFTAELREADGTRIGVDSRRTTVAPELVRQERCHQLVIGPLDLDLMGITVHVDRFTIGDPGARIPCAGPPATAWRAPGHLGGEAS